MTTPRPLVLGEISKVEELAGVPADQWENAPSKGKLTAALAFVCKRREDPKFTWNDALGLTEEEAGEILKAHGLGDDEAEPQEDELEDGDDVERPTKPARKPANRSRAASKTSAGS